jgi:hypothetical protein
MAVKFLDNTGLAYFWTKIKNYVINLLSSKADDSAVVHIAEAETVTGAKTFTSTVATNGSYTKKAGNIDKTATGTGEQESVIFNTVDKNNIAICQLNAERNLVEAFQELRFRNWNINNLWSDFRLRCTDDNKYWLTMAAKNGMSFGLSATDNSLSIPTTSWVRSATGNFACNAATASAVAWSGITNKPTTISGYGITDAKIANGTITLGSNSITPLTSHQTLPTLSRTISGSGNAITDITVSNHAITATKGSTFLTSASTLDATKLSGTIPSSCYTNTTYTAGTGLSLSGTKFSLASHNQASNTINAMTGYSKPSSTSAIAASDTLNQAIGKLEKAVDDADISNVVHKTGDEIIQGVKTFSNAHNWYTDGAETLSSIQIQCPFLERNTVPVDASYGGLIILDKNANGVDIDYSHRLAALEFSKLADNTSYIRLKTYNPTTIGAGFEQISVGYDENTIPYSTAPSTSLDRTDGEDILTRNWIPKDTRIVHTTGAETVAGAKTLNDKLTINNEIQINRDNGSVFGLYLRGANQNFGICLSATDITKGTNPSATEQYGIGFYGTDVSSWKQRIGYIGGKVATNGLCTFGIYTYDFHKTDGTSSGIEVTIDANGAAYTSAVTPAASSNTTNIATTAWVRTFCDTTQKYMKAVSVTGSGNAVTTASLSNGTLTLTKGTTFLTSHQSLANYATLNTEQTFSRGKHFWYWSAFKDQTYTYKQQVYCVVQFRDKNNAIYAQNKVFGSEDGTTAYYQWILNDPKKTISDSNNVTIELTVTNSSWTFCPVSNNDNVVTLGSAGRRWKQLYAGTTTIGTSDKRLKNSISDIPSKVLDAWDKINWVQFKFNDATDEKPADQVRLHTGLIAQDIQQIMLNDDVDISKYGLFCYDVWEHKDPIYDKEGNIIHNEVQAGDRYSLRYEEALCMEAAYQRRKNKILENRISELEKQVSDMLILLQNLTNGNG